MATQVYDTEIYLNSYDRTVMMNSFYNCFSRFDPRFTQESDTLYIVFDNRVKFDFEGRELRYLDMNNNTIISAGEFANRNQTVQIKIVITEHSFYAELIPNYNYGYIFFIYEGSSTITYLALYLDSRKIIDSGSYIYRFDSTGLLSVSGFSIVKICTTRLSSPYILFSTNCVVVTSTGTVGVLGDLRSCSTVTQYSTVTVNNKNYLAIGTNTLVEAPSS